MALAPQPSICAACGAENRATAKFCGSCGGSLTDVPCPDCGTPNPAGQAFCDECGRPLKAVRAAPAAPVERTAAGKSSTETTAPRALGAGRYRVLGFLGEGGRKRVYLAEDTQLRREVAVAICKSDGLDRTALTRARREAEAMARLSDHPNIVPIYDIGEEEDLYLVTQYMPGGDLEARLAASEGRRLPVEEAVRIATEIARALEYAHGHRFVHRDVKPGNVWLSPDGTAKLGDFGLAMALDRQQLTAEGAMVGTVAYMSPEQALGRPATARSDVYSLGALLYELLCGVPPFGGEDAAVVISQHATRAPVRPTWHRADVPRALENLVLALLAKSPEERPASATEVRQALEAIAAANSVERATVDDGAALEHLNDGLFLGREAELRELRNAVDSAFAGHGRIVMLVGEAGIGKTRLAAETDTYAELRGATVLWGRCTQSAGAPPYWPWIQAIRSYVRSVDSEVLRSELGSGASDIAQIVSEVGPQLGEAAGEALAMDPEQARFRLFDSVAGFLTNASQRTPIAIFLDDLHLADQPSLLLLQFVAAELASARILLVGTYREDELEADHPLRAVHAALGRERGYTPLRLRGLDAGTVKAFLEHGAHQPLESPAELAFVEAVCSESEGNPYFIQEIVRHLVESGAIYAQGDRWTSDAQRIEDLGIPQGIRDAVNRRLGRLSDACRELLATAAVFGREFGLSLLETISPLDEATIADCLREALDAAIVQPVVDEVGRYGFAHGTTRDALYEALAPARRVELHKAVGEALEEAYDARIESHLGELAHHFAQAAPAGVADKAADYAWWAGERAAQLYAYEDAVAHYRGALALFAAIDDDPTRRCELLLALGEALWRAGDAAQAQETFLAAAELARELSLPQQYGRAALGYGGGAGGFSVADRAEEQLVGLLRRALAMLPERDSVLRVRLTARLAIELHHLSGDPAEPDALSREAVEMADRIGDTGVLLLATYSRQWATIGPDGVEQQLSAGQEIVRLARIAGDEEMEFHGHHLRLLALLQLADLRGVDAEIRACARVARELRQPRYDWQVTVFRAMRALMHGRFEEGDRLAKEALAIGRRGRGELAIVAFGAQAFVARWADGRLAELEPGAAAFAETYRDSAWPAAFTFLLTEIDERERAAARFDALAKDAFGTILRDSNWLTAMACLAMTCLALRDARAAEQLHALLAPYADGCVPILAGSGSLGSTHAFAGHAAHAAGRLDEAIAAYASALEENARIGALFIAPRVRWRLAQALLERAGDGDRAAALQHIERGLDEAQQLGMPRERERLLALKLEQTTATALDVGSSIEEVARSVEQSRPDLRRAAAPDGTVTIMFSDIAGSTMLTQTLGDQRWLVLLRAHNAIVRESCARHGGYEVGTRGDGFMLAFASARRAISCALEIQQTLEAQRARAELGPLHVRIGLHTGEALRHDADFYGTNVNLAARIADQARGDQILVSSVLRDIVAATGEFEFELDREVELRGLTGLHRIYEVRRAA
jgi:class 3 adenylate cyclase